MRVRPWLHVAVSTGWLCCAVETRAAEPIPSPPSAAAQLASVDRFFLTAYGRAARALLGDPPPAFLVLSDRLVLYRSSGQQRWPLIPPAFNELKTIAHVTLGLFAVLSPSNGAPLAPDDVAALRTYQELIATARAAIKEADLTAAQRQRQERILDASHALAERALHDGRMTKADLTEFCRRLRPAIDANIDESVRLYLAELNRRMGEALPLLTPAERNDYLVIVTGVHQARIDNAAMQYFNRLMGDPPAVVQRLIYAENVADEAGALQLLGMHRMDRRTGEAYFEDPYRMNRDLFATEASRYVPSMQLPAGSR